MKLCVWPLSPFMYVRTWKSIGFHLDSLLALYIRGPLVYRQVQVVVVYNEKCGS